MSANTATQIIQEMDEVSDLDPGCVETFEQVKEELEEVERQLAIRLNIRRHVRRTLIVLDRANKLEEDELVARWHELYSSYADWARSDAWDEPPLVREESEERAAQAALAAFGDCLALSA